MAGYTESTEHPVISSLPLSHLSIEVGHFALKDIARDPRGIRAQLTHIAPLVAAFTESARLRFGRGARISTCYLIDDYFQPELPPADIVPKLLAAAADTGVRIDYLARESGCASATRFAGGEPIGEPVPIAEMVAARIVPDPAPPATGGRAPTAESGWLCNGRRSSEHDPAQAMTDRRYRPPEEFGRREHTIFLDVELWSHPNGPGRDKRWSCAFLAAVWHLLRLGMLRDHGAPVLDPLVWVPDDPAEPWPDEWSDLPAVIRLNPAAQPFAAYQTLSMLPKRYIGIEHAVRVILEHLDLDEDVVARTVADGVADGVTVPDLVSERLSHLLLDGS
ncbi:SCO2522 family protein [Nocardia stercoris]|uniref:Uncharacterized protein n=1 Tax=Nocardia stercoris TaxID=2483361 RepID=A0A3M2LEY2_9NOCA|nr:SCO2522 family protein [Nocardia stercoris]RMI33258.1 hypothetical protein EBN03_08710 [Nocardia stercoris]